MKLEAGGFAAPTMIAPPEPAREPQRPTPTRFEAIVSQLGSELDRGERMMDRAISGAGADLGRLDAAELIALQAGIYRYSETVEFAVKLVDRAVGAVRTTLSSGQG
jgi:hypothetical protein